MSKGVIGMVGNGLTGLLVPRGHQALRARVGSGGPALLPPRTRTITLNPAYDVMFRSQQLRRRNYRHPGAFPLGLTATAAAQEAIARAQLQAMPGRVQQPPYVTMPASGQSFTATDETVSTGTIVLPAA